MLTFFTEKYTYDLILFFMYLYLYKVCKSNNGTVTEKTKSRGSV